MTYAQEDATKREALRADLAAITKEAKAGQYDHFTREQLLSELNMESHINKDLSVMVDDAWKALERANEYSQLQSRDYILANKLLVEKHEINKKLVSVLKYCRDQLDHYKYSKVGIHHAAIEKADKAIALAEGN